MIEPAFNRSPKAPPPWIDLDADSDCPYDAWPHVDQDGDAAIKSEAYDSVTKAFD